jgi:hypothetical protein
MHYKKFVCNLPNRASKIKRLLAHHDVGLPLGSGQVLSCTSVIIILFLFVLGDRGTQYVKALVHKIT